MSDKRTLTRSALILDLARNRRLSPTSVSVLQTAQLTGPELGMFEPVNPGLDDVAPVAPDVDTDLTATEPLTVLRTVRPSDLFNGTFRFYNLHRFLLTNHAVRVDPSVPSYITLDLPGQHVAEEALEGSGGFGLPLKSRLAGRSRIAVRMPQGTSGVHLSTEALLDATASWPLSLDPLTRYEGGGLRRPMLEAVRDTFLQLGAYVFLQLSDYGLISLSSRTASLADPLIDSAYTLLTGNLSAVTSAAFVRVAIEDASNQLADEALEKYIGNAEAFRVRELAEAQMEVYFARRLADRLLNGPHDFSSQQLGQMTRLFNLMMHPHPPAATATALELPYRLITSPGPGTFFETHRAPRTGTFDRGERTELWRSYLKERRGIFRQELPEDGVDFFACWSPDYFDESIPAPPDFTMSLTAEDRRHIVKRTCGHNEERTEDSAELYVDVNYDPQPAKVRKLELTPLGASIDVDGQWDDAPAFQDFGSLTGWLHRTDLGRDTKVVVVRAGWLFPSGFPVSEIKLTERVFRRASSSERVMALRKKTFLVVNKPVLRFPEDGQEHDGRAMPFRRLEAVTRITPELVTSGSSINVPGVPRAYWLKTSAGFFPFEMAGTDDAGNTASFATSQIFVESTDAVVPTKLIHLSNAWNAALDAEEAAASDGQPMPAKRISATMSGQRVRMMPGNHPETDLALHRMTLDAARIGGNLLGAVEAGRRPFHPRIRSVTADVPGLEAIPGARDLVRQTLGFTQRYLDNALGGTAHPVVLQFQTPLDLDFAGGLGSDSVGAIGQASQNIAGIAAGSGLVPLPGGQSMNRLMDADLKWDVVLPDFSLLGRFALHQLLRSVNIPVLSLPIFKTRRSSQDIERVWELSEPIEETATIGMISLAPLNGNARVTLRAVAAVTVDTFSAGGGIGSQVTAAMIPTGARSPRVEAHGTISEVGLSLFELIEVHFREIGFDAVSGRKPDARVKLDVSDPLVFHGSLAFLNGLKDLIPPNGFGDGPRITPRIDGIEAAFDLALPNVEIGVFSLKNMTLGAATEIPFNNRPVDLRFNFNERHRPFEIAVAGFGGGGFFALVVDTGGIQEIEASLEFGAVASMNIGVASGSVSVKGGIYFRYASGDMVLEGFVELRGRMSVLGLITASLLFHMALAYEIRGSRKFVRGEATLRIEVEVLFFSTSVTLHVERSFSAGSNDPKLAEMIGPNHWAAYCGAFA